MARLYDTVRWKRRRARQLRDEPLCRLCLALHNVVTGATVADHIEPHRGDPELFWNGELQSLCDSCHSSLKQQQERSGRFEGSDLDGNPIDPAHPWNAGGRGKT